MFQRPRSHSADSIPDKYKDLKETPVPVPPNQPNIARPVARRAAVVNPNYKLKLPAVLEEKEDEASILRKMSENDQQCYELLLECSRHIPHSVWHYFWTPAPWPNHPFCKAMETLDALGIRGQLLYRYFELQFHDGKKPDRYRHYKTIEAFITEVTTKAEDTESFVLKIINGTAEEYLAEKAQLAYDAWQAQLKEDGRRAGEIYSF